MRGYPSKSSSNFTATKTGLTPLDLQQFVGVPLQYYGNPPTAVPPTQIQEWIRWAEDKVEQDTSILLCQTWVASPPTPDQNTSNQCGIITVNGGGQQQGIDFDLQDAGYDFQYPRAQDEGWMYQTLRYRPVQSMGYSPANPTAVKNIAFIYPLLNVFFRLPRAWIVEDRDYGLIRMVPATNTQMLPLWAMQLAFMGFAESLPNGLWFQYTAGLTPNDYNSRFSFMKELVLAEAALTALNSIQGTINLGANSIQSSVDGLQMRFQYGKDGPFGALIMQMGRRAKALRERATTKVSGLMVGVI